MTYKAPTGELLFVLREVADLDSLLRLPAFHDVPDDVVEAVLLENARFVQEAIAPLNRVGDTRPPAWADGQVTTSPGFQQAFRSFAEAGWQGLQHAQAWGGQGLPKLVGAAAGENLNAASLAFSLCPLLTDGVIEALATVGSGEQQERYIPPMLEGRWTGTMNLTEPQAGSDLAMVTTRAVKQTDGRYRLFGQKIFITYGEHDLSDNIIHLVLARTPDAPPGIRGLSLFIVPKFLVNPDGGKGPRNDVWCASLEHKLGIHGSPTAVLLYGSGKAEADEAGALGELVGEENRGLEYMFIMMNAARFAVGVQGVALCERALQKADSYARERIQGRAIGGPDAAVAIIGHPDVQRMLCTMSALTQGARALAYWTAAACDRARHHPDEAVRAENQAIYEYLVPVVKGYATETAVEVASLGIQVHGGMGYIEETGAAQYYRDARILPIYEGTTAIQANDFVARKTVRDGGALALALLARMRASCAELAAAAGRHPQEQDGIGFIAQRFAAALDAWETATAFVLQNAAGSPAAVFMGSVPYLLLTGTVHAAWHMVRAALACLEGAQAPAGKLASCVSHAALCMPRAVSLGQMVESGIVAEPYARQALSE